MCELACAGTRNAAKLTSSALTVANWSPGKLFSVPIVLRPGSIDLAFVTLQLMVPQGLVFYMRKSFVVDASIESVPVLTNFICFGGLLRSA